jgi:radical SAM superfamily enzyme YgiQ (UPF0313 family)
MKKLLLLNLPNRDQITRRYMCSYVSPESLLPPLELLSAAAMAREWHGMEVRLVDAIVERLTEQEVTALISAFQPDMLLSITGFECFGEDMDVLREIKASFPNTVMVLFGHYATHFPEETLRHSGADYVIMGEPELTLSKLIKALAGQLRIEDAQNIALLKDGRIAIQGSGSRIPNPNDLPPPALDLLPRGGHYYEPLMPEPFGMIQTARGCPYQCNFCVKSYGSKLTELTPERVVEEMRLWKQLFDVRSIRFIDDTFTINRKRVLAICELLKAENLGVAWACLSRTDNLDRELLLAMKSAGCIRIYFGMESGSQRMLDLYKKQLKAEEAASTFRLCRELGIETAAFFMSGHPDETDEDFHQTVRFARQSGINFASYNPLTPYPGTPLFSQMADQLNFSIYPYRNEWKNQSVYDDFDRRKKIFYRKFYFRARHLLGNAPVLARNWGSFVSYGSGMLRYLLWDSKFVLSGIKGAKDR